MAETYGRWRIRESLAAGGQAEIFLVEDPSEPGKLHVLKRLRNPKRLERFRAEVDAALRLDHPNIVKHVDHDLDGDRAYLVQEHCQLGHLRQVFDGGMEPIEALRVFIPLLKGVAHAHDAGVVHRDLKPENVFVRADRTIAVGDFGLCFLADDGSRATLTEEAVGSFKFLAPELADGRGEVTRQADVYALGKLLYWLLAGRVFDREKHQDPNWDLRGQDRYRWLRSEFELIVDLLDHSIVETPGTRFSSARHFLANAELALWRLERGFQPTRRSAALTCRFCGLGEYQMLADSDNPTGRDQDELDRCGLRLYTGVKWLVMWCNNCGHIEHFRRDLLITNDPWGPPDT